MGQLSAPASPGLTDQLFNTTECGDGAVEGAYLALITSTFYFLHRGNWFFANDTSFFQMVPSIFGGSVAENELSGQSVVQLFNQYPLTVYLLSSTYKLFCKLRN